MKDTNTDVTTGEPEESNDRPLLSRLDRREYLKATGVIAGGSLVTGRGGAAPGRGGKGPGTDPDRVPMPTDLHTEYERDPDNVPPNEAPRLSWRFPPAVRRFEQDAYRIQVATGEDGFADDANIVWDSGRVDAGRSTTVRYGGPELDADRTYHWRVRIWNADGAASEWSESTSFSTALPDSADAWDGEWLGATPAQSGEDVDPTEWTDYVLEATFRIEQTAAGFLLRAQDGGTFYLWQLVLEESPQNATDSHLLRPHRFEDGAITVLDGGPIPQAGVPIDEAIDDPHGEQTLRIELSGDEITTSINGVPVDTRTDPVFDRGTVGFRQYGPDDEHVSVDTMTVTDPEGDVLYANDFTEASDSGFDGGQVADGRLELDGTGVVLYAPDEAEPLGSPLLRTETRLSGSVASARAHVVTLGYGELYVNGDRIGDEQLNPAKTEYDSRVLYSTHDVTDHVTNGTNAIGLWLGRGWFGFNDAIGVWNGTDWSPQALLQLNVTYEDGRTDSIVTDGSWRMAASPIVENNVYDGEAYDARDERPGWAKPGHDDGHWKSPAVVDPPGDDVDVSPQRLPPITVTETIQPESVTERADGYLVDFGQNHTGWTELTIRGADAGDEITVRHAETLMDPDGELTRDTEIGELNTIDLRQADATDVYVARGATEETYAPRFTYHGYRYALVEGYPGELTDADIHSNVVHTGYDRTGSFACSNDELNRVQENAVWGLRSNANGYPMDCPQRDERLGWTGDVHQNVHADFFNFGNASRFHEKWLRDHDDNQRSEGYVTDTIPQVASTVGGPADPNWGKTRVIIPWRSYRQTGDEHLLADNFPGMRDYVDYWHEQADDHILGAEHLSYGDWLAFEGQRTDPALYNTFAHYQTTDLVARAADALDRDDLARTYRERADAIADAFNDAFLGRASEHFDGGAIEDESLVLGGSGVALYDEGSADWSDYTLAAEFTLEANAAGFVFRAADGNNLYMWQVNTAASSVPVLRPHVRVDGGWTVLDQIELDGSFDGDTAHRIEIEAVGDEIVTSIDGNVVDERTDTSHRSGTIGFRQAGGERVRVHSVSVTGPDGTTLFADDFADGGRLAYGTGTQTTYALPLYSGIVPDEHEETIAETLAEKVRTEDGGKLQTGFIGTRPLIHSLADHGYEELAYNVVSQPEQPGWVYMVRNGATTMWERWDSDERVGSGMNSFNHRPWTLVSEWFYRKLAGIDIGTPGYDHMEISPMVVEDLDWAEGETETVRGRVAARWERAGSDGRNSTAGELTLEVTVPGNSTATVEIPTLGGDKVRVRESGKPIWNNGNRTRPNHAGIESVERDGDVVAVRVGSGDYAFELERIGR